MSFLSCLGVLVFPLLFLTFLYLSLFFLYHNLGIFLFRSFFISFPYFLYSERMKKAHEMLKINLD